jgi:Xaa-Pro aminopeptidase
MRPGTRAADVFAGMHRAIIGRYPDGSFPHHGGHGVGVTVFEAPHLIPADDTLLRDGMVIAVEPGVYLPGRFGVRVENIYLVTPDGGRDLLSAFGS